MSATLIIIEHLHLCIMVSTLPVHSYIPPSMFLKKHYNAIARMKKLRLYKRLCNLLRITELVNDKARMQTSAFLTPKPVFLTNICIILIKSVEDTEL